MVVSKNGLCVGIFLEVLVCSTEDVFTFSFFLILQRASQKHVHRAFSP
jgi:hypothetical protein